MNKATYEINGWLDDRLMNDGWEELIYDMFADKFKEHTSIHVYNKDVLPDGLSRIVEFDFENEKIELGRDDTIPPDYSIRPDYAGVEDFFTAFDEYEKGSMRPFPVPLPANPMVPHNKYYDYDEDRKVEVSFVNSGYKILDPTPSQVGMVSEHDIAYSSEVTEGLYFDKFALNFDRKVAFQDKVTIVAMEFNPFNPAATKMIQTGQWESEYVYSGTYNYRNRINRFRFDLQSGYYRLHPDIWMPLLGITGEIAFLSQMYDLVCVKEFFKELDVGQDYIMSVRKLFGPNIIEPYFTNRQPDWYYSNIGPWAGGIWKGMKEKFCSPALTVDFKLSDFKDYSTFDKVEDFLIDGNEIFDREKSVKINFDGIYIRSKNYYLWRGIKDSVLMRRNENGAGKYYFYEVGIRIISSYCNKFGSLMLHPRSIPVNEVVMDHNRDRFDKGMHLEIWGTYANEGYKFLDEVIPGEQVQEKMEVVNPFLGISMRKNMPGKLNKKRMAKVRGDREILPENEKLRRVIEREHVDSRVSYKQKKADNGKHRVIKQSELNRNA